MKPANYSQKLLNVLAIVILVALSAVFIIYLAIASANKSAEKIFWSAIEQSLSTPGVTREFVQDGDFQKLTQATNTTYTGRLQVETTLDIVDVEGSARSTTQLLGTKDSDYIRYREIFGAGRTLNDDVKDRWAELPAVGGESGQLIREALLGTILPTGNFNSANRKELIDFLKVNIVYKVGDFKDRGQEVSGRKVDIITFTVNTNAYQRFVKKYLEKMGMDELAETIAVSEQDGDDVDAEVAIHVPSKQIVKIGADSIDNPAAETFKNWGGLRRENLPTDVIDFTALQSGITNDN